MNNSEFYNLLASNYDEMINFESSVKNKAAFLKDFISPEYKSALDLGCGTGADSIALAELGFRVDAVDHSFEMLKKAEKNSIRHDKKINFRQSDISELSIDGKNYDFIVSLGNTLVNIQKEKMRIIFGILEKSLFPGGKILIQTINYAKLPKNGNYILNKLENEEKTIIRRYVFYNEDLDFIIDITDKKKNIKESLKTKLYRHTAEEFRELADLLKFKCEIFGNLKKEPYFEKKSENIVILLSK